MSSDAGESEALDRLIAQWAARIRRSSGTTVETILMQAENVLSALSDLRPYGPKARRMLQARSRLSQPMVSKLEAIGRHVGLMRLKANRLPPSVSFLYVLTQKPRHQFLKSIEIDLRGMSRSEIRQLFAPAAPARSRHTRITITIPAGVADETLRDVMEEIGAALERIGSEHGIGLAISPPQAINPIPRSSRKTPCSLS